MGLNDADSRIMVVPTPTQLPNVTDAIQVAAGNSIICVLQRNGQVMCAGDNAACEVDFTCGNTFEVPTFTKIAGLNNVKKIAVGTQFACALTDDERLYCWGMNAWGQLGRGNNNSAPSRLPYGVSFLISPDFGGGTTMLQDAYLGLDLNDALKFRVGKFRPPFGLERLQPTSNLSFVEFGLPTLLTPNCDVGAIVHGDLFGSFFGYAGGIFNGVPDNGSANLDTDSQKEFAGRAYFRPFRLLGTEALGRLFIGVATTFGRVYGNPTNTALPNPASTPAYKTPDKSVTSHISAPRLA
jgi:hypothetical protein